MQSFTILCTNFHTILCRKIATVISRLVLEMILNYKVFCTNVYAHEMFVSREFIIIF